MTDNKLKREALEIRSSDSYTADERTSMELKIELNSTEPVLSSAVRNSTSKDNLHNTPKEDLKVDSKPSRAQRKKRMSKADVKQKNTKRKKEEEPLSAEMTANRRHKA
eukprot:IDg18803t1